MSQPLVTPHGGYRKLYSFTFVTMIHLGTIRFCRRFISYKDDPLGKTAGQMIGAARSGRQNIIEGSERAGTSRETEMKLTDVARASLGELLGDYEIYLADKGGIPWSRESKESKIISGFRLKPFDHTGDCLHDYWSYYHREKMPFIQWLESDNDVVAANSMLITISRTMAMLEKQLDFLGKEFLDNGGFRERMYQSRKTQRDAENTVDPTAPSCPKCGKPMRKRIPREGGKADKPFWGCPDFPDCRGTRPANASAKERTG